MTRTAEPPSREDASPPTAAAAEGAHDADPHPIDPSGDEVAAWVARQMAAGDAAPDAVTPDAIRERAYDLWERHHRPEGYEIEFWVMAERELWAERRRGTPGAAAEGARGRP